MYSSIFYTVGWTAQVGAGVALFTLSYLIESYVLAQYLNNGVLAMALAGALEVSKALSVVFYRFMKSQAGGSYPPGVAAMLLMFRFTLLVLSLICSIMYFAEQLDRPDLEAVRAADRAQVEQDSADWAAELRADFAARRRSAEEALGRRSQQSAQQAEQRWLPQLRELEAQLSKEMDNTRNGVFIGPQYREIERRIRAEGAVQAERIDDTVLRDEIARERNRLERRMRKATEALSA